MPNSLVGIGGSGGGGGFVLGPATNTFNAATQAAGVTARNTYATNNATWLAQYDANPNLMVRVTWPTTPTSSAYYARAASAWVEVTGVVTGPEGEKGDKGDQGNQGSGVPVVSVADDGYLLQVVSGVWAKVVGIPANHITSGILALARIPEIPLTKLTSAVQSRLLPTGGGTGQVLKKTDTAEEWANEKQFDLYDDVSTESTTPADGDRVVTADVSESGAPNRWLSLSRLGTYILGKLSAAVVLSLAKTHRTTDDRGKVLSVSADNENELSLIDDHTNQSYYHKYNFPTPETGYVDVTKASGAVVSKPRIRTATKSAASIGSDGIATTTLLSVSPIVPDIGDHTIANVPIHTKFYGDIEVRHSSVISVTNLIFVDWIEQRRTPAGQATQRSIRSELSGPAYYIQDQVRVHDVPLGLFDSSTSFTVDGSDDVDVEIIFGSAAFHVSPGQASAEAFAVALEALTSGTNYPDPGAGVLTTAGLTDITVEFRLYSAGYDVYQVVGGEGRSSVLTDDTITGDGRDTVLSVKYPFVKGDTPPSETRFTWIREVDNAILEPLIRFYTLTETSTLGGQDHIERWALDGTDLGKIADAGPESQHLNGLAADLFRLAVLNDSTNTVEFWDKDGTRQSTEDISLGNAGSNRSWQAIAITEDRVYVVETGIIASVQGYVRVWNRATKARVSAEDITLPFDSANAEQWRGIAITDDRIYLWDDYNDYVRVWQNDASITRQSSEDVSISGTYYGFTATDDRFYLTGGQHIDSYDHSGVAKSSERVTLEQSAHQGVAAAPEWSVTGSFSGRQAGTGLTLDGNILNVDNPFTSADEAKLDGIESGAEVNPDNIVSFRTEDGSNANVAGLTFFIKSDNTQWQTGSVDQVEAIEINATQFTITQNPTNPADTPSYTGWHSIAQNIVEHMGSTIWSFYYMGVGVALPSSPSFQLQAERIIKNSDGNYVLQNLTVLKGYSTTGTGYNWQVVGVFAPPTGADALIGTLKRTSLPSDVVYSEELEGRETDRYASYTNAFMAATGDRRGSISLFDQITVPTDDTNAVRQPDISDDTTVVVAWGATLRLDKDPNTLEWDTVDYTADNGDILYISIWDDPTARMDVTLTGTPAKVGTGNSAFYWATASVDEVNDIPDVSVVGNYFQVAREEPTDLDLRIPASDVLDPPWMGIDISPIAPSDPTDNKLWLDTTTGLLKQYSVQVTDDPDRYTDLTGISGSPHGFVAHGDDAWVIDRTLNQALHFLVSDAGPLIRDDRRDFDLDSSNNNPVGGCTDGTRIWVGDNGAHKAFAYLLTTGARASSYDITFDSSNQNATSLGTDGSVVWIGDNNDGKAYAHTIGASMPRNAGKDITFEGGLDNPHGMALDGDELYIVDATDDIGYAFTLSNSVATYDSGNNFTLVSGSTPVAADYDNGVIWVTDIGSPDHIRGYRAVGWFPIGSGLGDAIAKVKESIPDPVPAETLIHHSTTIPANQVWADFATHTWSSSDKFKLTVIARTNTNPNRSTNFIMEGVVGDIFSSGDGTESTPAVDGGNRIALRISSNKIQWRRLGGGTWDTINARLYKRN